MATKSFHKDYLKGELKAIIKSWNKHFRIYVTGKDKKQLADELDKHLEHDEDGELSMKQNKAGIKTGLKDYHDQEINKKQARLTKRENIKSEKERQRLTKIVQERQQKDAEEKAIKSLTEKLNKQKKERDRLKAEEAEKAKKAERDAIRKSITGTALQKKAEEAKKKKQLDDETEAKRVESFRNTDATSKLPYDVSSKIFSFLPKSLQKDLTEGTRQEKYDRANRDMFKFFEKQKYGKTKKEGEKFYDDLIDQSEEFQEIRSNRESRIADELYSDYMDSRKRGPTLAQEEAAQGRAQDKAVELAKKYYIEEFIELKKQGKTNKEIVEDFLERSFDY